MPFSVFILWHKHIQRLYSLTRYRHLQSECMGLHRVDGVLLNLHTIMVIRARNTVMPYAVHCCLGILVWEFLFPSLFAFCWATLSRRCPHLWCGCYCCYCCCSCCFSICVILSGWFCLSRIRYSPIMTYLANRKKDNGNRNADNLRLREEES